MDLVHRVVHGVVHEVVHGPGSMFCIRPDNGIGADSSKALCSQKSQLVQHDLGNLGLLVNEEKSDFEPGS